MIGILIGGICFCTGEFVGAWAARQGIKRAAAELRKNALL